ncbi:hypothetical protein K1T71_001098 [Dendrolimus kikuchii]|uniref:Uncharacterized protein n=5 Tax=Dendrolimus kikuchii TaxID=765133 RepID=A0ACC1DA59_9NEOP|nr:hypothetical protein K1T71_012368 [Dendrolimus kikuchii]KAJ0172865.1 hypothetical protein K1T71_011041 [Dendrolimus kikuchii]KAJ0179736.1 hypothetical protein K1T71_004327 [Dendrolimus kikuchii]KAJ0180809.1 hypothetical protein K1T71_004213 [Dendrolimus kikuchii]KAJ0183122.1 hypothetical protein K1T71_001098 [Dendrolimus kikuchii]
MPIGKLEPFNLNSKQWPAYIRRVNQYILLNDIKAELKVPMLITVVGEATYALMCDLCSPDFPEDKNYDELVSLVTNHLEPQRSEIAERHVFRLRRQRVGEPLTEYLQALKHLAATCNFGRCKKCSTLDENLRDQFVSGLHSDAMRSRIFAEKKIQYKEAVELALALEAAEKHAEVSGNTTPGTTSGAGGEAGEGLHYARPGRGRAERAGRRAAGASGAAPAQACWRCGKAHRADLCRYKNYNCDECNQRGHLKVMCKKVKKSGERDNRRHNYVSGEDDSDDLYNIVVTADGSRPYFVKLIIDSNQIECEIDTGSRISAISDRMYNLRFSHKVIKPDNAILRSYSGSRIESLGYIKVDVSLGGVNLKSMPLYIIKGGARPLLGREWMRALKISQIRLNEISEDGYVSQLRSEYPEVFSDKLGTCKQKIRLQVTDHEPVYVRARPVPLALRGRVEAELDRLQADGTIYRVDYSEYGTPIVPVVKSNGDIRICGDYKITINPKLKRDFYPLPRIEELFAALSGGEKFTKIDLTHAFEQCLLSEESQPYTAITTHIGTFAYRRTPYGLSCIPEKFQKIMEETLRGVPGCVVFLDDICVSGSTTQNNLRNVRSVLDRLRNMGLTVKLNKCNFLQNSVKYLGFVISKEGLRPDPAKIEAIVRVPTPTNITELKSFLGMLNYYGKFIRNLSTLLHPLHTLLKKEQSWQWCSNCERAFEEAKRILLSDRVLAHYEEGRPVVLSVDSSAYGLGAVLSHIYPDGSERPVSYVSRTLSAAEQKYSQLDKEALAIYFGVTKHHHYLYGRHFTLRTDHQPLTYILGPNTGIPQTAAGRLQRWATRLSAYDFTVKYIRSADNGPADALSRLPLPHEERFADTISYLNLIEESFPITFKRVAKETEKDALLSKIKGYIMFGWPSSVQTDEEKCYFDRKQHLVVELGCLIYKYRIIIPSSLQEQVLSEIHEGHLGINKMKNIARNYVYWPYLDKHIEETCRSCDACRTVRDSPAHAPLHPWEFPLYPWQRLHADFADCGGKRYLIVVDAHSKWIEAIAMHSTEAHSTIIVLRSIFARFGLPIQLVTDNGPPFFSHEFKTFCQKNCIKHVTSAPYRPQGNGAAENAVKTVKKVIKRALFEGENVSTALSKFLLRYRNCDHATTGVSPAVALQGRRLRGRLDALRPDTASVVRDAQQRQISSTGGTARSLNPGDDILARDYTAKGNKWAVGRVVKKTGPVSYKVDVGRGVEWRRHIDQLVPVGRDKSRHSLSRTSLAPVEEETQEETVEKPVEVYGEPEDTYEDASDCRDEKAPSVEREFVMVDAAAKTGSPPPDASSRARRAHQRSQRCKP